MATGLLKYLYISIGIFTLVLGSLGIVVPLLPTTPFLLLSAYFFVRSSNRLYVWLLNHRLFGAYIKSYVTYRAITFKTKIAAISLIWLSMIPTMLIFRSLLITVFLIVMGGSVSIYLARMRTLTKEEIVNV